MFLVLVPLAIWGDLRKRPVTVQRVIALLAVFVVLGVIGSATRAMPTDAEAIAYLVASGAIAIVFGAWRGRAIDVWHADEGWYKQGNRTTVILWAATIALKGALALVVSGADIYPAEHSGELYFFFAISFGVEELLIARRTIWSRVPATASP